LREYTLKNFAQQLSATFYLREWLAGFTVSMSLILNQCPGVKPGNKKGNQMNTAIETLNTICNGWTESAPGALLCNSHKSGGIIDSEIVSGKWFVIFNDSRKALEGFASREAAVAAFVATPASAVEVAKTDLTVAHEIQRQLGRALVMLGAHNLLGDADSLTFAIRGCRIVSHIKIKVDADDTYSMQFLKVRRASLKSSGGVDTVEKFAGVYCDMLASLIEDVTGLAVSL
jgi:hypothetical protein